MLKVANNEEYFLPYNLFLSNIHDSLTVFISNKYCEVIFLHFSLQLQYEWCQVCLFWKRLFFFGGGHLWNTAHTL